MKLKSGLLLMVLVSLVGVMWGRKILGSVHAQNSGMIHSKKIDFVGMKVYSTNESLEPNKDKSFSGLSLSGYKMVTGNGKNANFGVMEELSGNVGYKLTTNLQERGGVTDSFGILFIKNGLDVDKGCRLNVNFVNKEVGFLELTDAIKVPEIVTGGINKFEVEKRGDGKTTLWINSKKVVENVNCPVFDSETARFNLYYADDESKGNANIEIRDYEVKELGYSECDLENVKKGDMNCDGKVDILDFGIWRKGYLGI